MLFLYCLGMSGICLHSLAITSRNRPILLHLVMTEFSINFMYSRLFLSHFVNFRIYDGGLCDIRRRPCKKTDIFGQDFISSENLTCHVQEFKVNIKSMI
jgi:hypothetical protein